LYDSDVPVSVSAGVMQQNLTTSRVPAYPEIAKVQGVEGSVLMQVVISKDGTVYEVHAIQGDEMLRGAAEEAVAKWRYRPYILNGTPVNVVTNVRVDFKLPRR
jgi:TonB family protein